MPLLSSLRRTYGRNQRQKSGAAAYRQPADCSAWLQTAASGAGLRNGHKPLSGNFNLSDIVGGYSASIRFETANYEVSYDIGTEGDKWKQYNQGQYVTSEERVLTHVNTSDNITNKHYCYIGTAPAPKK